MESAEHRPVRLVVRDDLERSRLTVVFRIFLAIPLLVWVVLRGVAAFFVAFVNWLAVLVQGEVPESTHDFVASYIRYATQVSAYVFLAANPYPWFRVQQDYPIDVEIDPPVPQGRWGGFFRIVLALPALLLATALGGGFASGSSGQGSWTASSSGSEEAYWWNVSSVGGVAAAAALLAWFAIVVRGGAPRGLRDLVAFTLGYAAQAGAYLFLLTPRYPTSDPELAEPYSVLPDHPVRMVVTDDLERPRLTVLFRLFLAIPHIVWILLWSIAVVLRRSRRLVGGADHRSRSGRAPSLPQRVRPLRHAPRCLHLSHRAPFPRVHGTPGLVRDRRRDRSGDEAESLEDAVSALPRDPGAHPRERARRRRPRDRVPRVVVRARDGADARGNAEPRGVVSALLGADVCVRPARHEPVPVRRPDPAREGAGRVHAATGDGAARLGDAF